MSFILDALRKSETERQQQGTAEFSGVPTRREQPRAPTWLWVLGVLLAVNLAVLVGLLLKKDDTAPPADAQPTVAQPVASPDAAPEAKPTGFAERVEAARRNAPPREEPATPAAERPEPAPAATASTTSAGSAAVLPTIHEVQANGAVTLPELHIDIHVFSEVPEDRFVFINMVKHKEGSRLAEGPVVDEITADGVVLRHNGIVFLVPRD